MKFPRMHIAQSVTNRILNLANSVQLTQMPPVIPPPLPNVAAQGAALDAALRQPGVAAAPPDGVEPAMTTAALEGDSALDEATRAQIIS